MSLKIVHLPEMIGGNPNGISSSLKQLELQSECWSLSENFFNYKVDKIIWKKSDSFLFREIKRLLALSYILKFDAVFFNFGSSLYPAAVVDGLNKPYTLYKIGSYLFKKYCIFFRHFELTALRYLKKPIFIQYQGDDARQGDYCLSHFKISPATVVDENYYTVTSDNLKRMQIDLFSKYCSKIYALNPDLLYLLPSNAEFLPYSHISLEEWAPQYTQLDNRPLRIGHAPTNRKVKGTDLILEALSNLRDKGLNFELILVEGISNSAAKDLYKTIDVLVDQLFCGWYGGLAVEAMALGKPVIVYIRNEDLKFIPPEMRMDMPLINATPLDIESVLEKVIQMPRKELYELALRSRAYVERWHDPLIIAKRIKSDLMAAKKACE